MAFPFFLIPIAINAIRAGVSASKNKGLKRDFEKADAGVNPIDPNQIAFLNRLRSQEQRFRAGTDPSSAFAMQGVQQQGAQTQRNMLRAGGPGSVGNMLRAQQVTNQGAAGVGAQAAAMGNQLLGMQQGMTNLIADRVYNRQRELSNRALAMWQQNRQDVQNAISGITSTLPDMAMNTMWRQSPNPRVMTQQINNSLPSEREMSRVGIDDALPMQPRQIMPMGSPLPYQPLQ